MIRLKVSSAALLLSAYLCSSFNPAFSQNLVEGETYSTGDIISNDPNAWEGCYNVIGRDDHGGYSSPGGCPGVASDWVIMSYTQQTIKQTVQISQALQSALQQAGINVDGYFYHWHWKNGDANWNQNDGADPLSVGVRIYDKDNNLVYQRTWNHTFDSDPWNYVTGTETFADPFDANDLSSFEFSISGRDSGYWAGYYGGEIEHMIIQLRYSVRPADGPSLEDQTVLNAQCSSDPTFSPECPGYNDAILAQMTSTTSTATPEDTLSINTGVPDTTGGTTNDVATESTQSTGMDPVAEATATPVQEVQAAAVATTTAETTATTAEPTATGPSQTTSQRPAGPGLNANQLAALDAASNAANAAIGIAGESSTASQSSSSGSSGSNSGSGSAGGSSGDGSSLSADGQDDGSSSDGSSSTGGVDLASSGLSGQDQSLAEGGAIEEASIGSDFASSDFIVASLTTDLIKDIINSISEKTLQDIKDEQKEDMEEQNAESIEEANKKEDELVQAAKEGSKDEDAQAALLGYNPSFRAYQQPQMADSEFYKDKEIYADQRTYDNPNARLFNGASDAKHRDMVRQQYGN